MLPEYVHDYILPDFEHQLQDSFLIVQGSIQYLSFRQTEQGFIWLKGFYGKLVNTE